MDDARFDDEPRCDVKWSPNCDNKGLFKDDAGPEYFCAHCHALCVKCRKREWTETVDQFRVCVFCGDAIRFRRQKEAEIEAEALKRVPDLDTFKEVIHSFAYGLYELYRFTSYSTPKSRRLAGERLAEALEWMAATIRRVIAERDAADTDPVAKAEAMMLAAPASRRVQ